MSRRRSGRYGPAGGQTPLIRKTPATCEKNLFPAPRACPDLDKDAMKLSTCFIIAISSRSDDVIGCGRGQNPEAVPPLHRSTVRPSSCVSDAAGNCDAAPQSHSSTAAASSSVPDVARTCGLASQPHSFTVGRTDDARAPRGRCVALTRLAAGLFLRAGPYRARGPHP